jgi:putative transposase
MKSDQGYRKVRKSFNIQGHAHELTFSCYSQRPFLKYDVTKGFVIHSILRARAIHTFDIWAYVIMPEHVHLLIWPRNEQYSIPKILQSIKQSSAKKAIKYLQYNKPENLKWLYTGQKHTPYRFWQDGGGYDKNVDSVEILLEMVDYIHMNPVRRGLVKEPEEWKWSSIAEWQLPGSGPIPVDRESFPVLTKSDKSKTPL